MYDKKCHSFESQVITVTGMDFHKCKIDFQKCKIDFQKCKIDFHNYKIDLKIVAIYSQLGNY